MLLKRKNILYTYVYYMYLKKIITFTLLLFYFDRRVALKGSQMKAGSKQLSHIRVFDKQSHVRTVAQ